MSDLFPFKAKYLSYHKLPGLDHTNIVDLTKEGLLTITSPTTYYISKAFNKDQESFSPSDIWNGKKEQVTGNKEYTVDKDVLEYYIFKQLNSIAKESVESRLKLLYNSEVKRLTAKLITDYIINKDDAS